MLSYATSFLTPKIPPPSQLAVLVAGGATPTNSQSILYLARNEVITSLQDLYAECSVSAKAGVEDTEVRELGEVLGKGVRSYVDALDKDDVKEARKVMGKII